MKNLLKKANYFLWSLIRNEPTSPALSRIINQYLDDPDTTIVIHDEYSCTLHHPSFKTLPLWISNYPYCYGFLYPTGFNWTRADLENYDELKKIFGRKLPDRKTVYRLHEAVENRKKELGYYPDSVEKRARELLNV